MSVLLSCRGLTKSYGPRTLFTDISIDVRDGERIGLIGPNGAGKSTLFRIFAGLETADAGEVARLRKARIGFLPQESTFDGAKTVEETVLEATADLGLEEYERHTQVGITLGKVGFEDPSQKVGILSGGWRKRVALARELVRDPVLLLLDEPTNHLDLEGILWLEELLASASFAYVVISHDRYLLENATNQVIEFDKVYPEGYLRAEGAFSDFLTRREEFVEMQARQELSLANKVRREVEWLKRGARARTTKSTARTAEAQRLMSELRTMQGRNAVSGSVGIDFEATGRKSTKLLKATGISKQLGDRPLFGDLSFELTPGTKLGLLGRNGSGKTTLLRCLTGEMTPDAGTLERADGLRVVVFDQDRRQLDRTATLKRALSPNSDTVEYRGRAYHLTAWAKRFLFRPEQLEVPVSDLSGGEQARILIARLMLKPADVLLLDEPTNDLDIASLEVLEESLEDFPGALVLVTHDRSLLDRLCSAIVGLDGQGGSRVFSDYTQWTAAQAETDAAVKKAASKPAAREAVKKKKMAYKEQKELESMEKAIHEAEHALAARHVDVETAGTDHVRLKSACEALQSAQEEVDRLYRRWQELEALRDGASG
ncbi:MAG TPA: ABC-F family ATP-binding cassette domain-containing protein [Gemmataceae bacterium]|jgi:ATP-binding cassette subfamily F protein uup|nr:ABC-F family ATP-binding cassette domain-containing protein [Gemmataceae bacterium]